MKIKQKHIDLCRFYMNRGIRHGEDSPFGSRWYVNAKIGKASAVESFMSLESTGKLTPTCSPIMTRWMITGKALVKLTIDMWIKDIEDGVLTKYEAIQWCSEWPQTERNNVLGRLDKALSGSIY